VFELYHVAHAYSGAAQPALMDVTLRIDRGAFVVVAGASGAGKSSLLRLLAGAEVASAGQVLFHGKNLGRLRGGELLRVRRSMASVFQDFRLLPSLTVMQNVTLALEVRGLAHKTCVSRAMQALAEVGVAHKAAVRPSELSGGEQQRVAIARALVSEPAVLLCDEPTGNLDQHHATFIAQRLTDAHIRGSTVVVATHEPELFAGGQRRLVTLHGGRVSHDVVGFGGAGVT
jgi:cell division transport system ATP-binding protein